MSQGVIIQIIGKEGEEIGRIGSLGQNPFSPAHGETTAIAEINDFWRPLMPKAQFVLLPREALFVQDDPVTVEAATIFNRLPPQAQICFFTVE